MKIASAGLVVSAFALSASNAQQPFHAIVFTTGASTMSVEALNTSLSTSKFAGLSNDGIAYGGNAYFAFGRALLGIDLARVTYGEEGLSNGRSDDLTATQSLATIGYAAYSSGKLTVFPAVGIGLGHFDVTLRDRSGSLWAMPSQPTFQEFADNPGYATTLSGNHLLFSASTGLDYLVTRSSGGPGIVLGLRGGYLFAPNRTTWTSNGQAVIAGPDASAGGPFVRLVVGVGGR